MLRLFASLLLICSVLPLLGQTAGELAFAMSTRYAPYANWEKFVDVDQLEGQQAASYWRSADTLRAARSAEDLPLAGLHLALDPGHVGGRWAAYEGRDFVINEGDYRVREGELVLEVAQRVREQLQALGAEVTLLREGDEPVNLKPPFDYLEVAGREVQKPTIMTFEALMKYRQALRNRSVRLSVVIGEIVERARLVNEVIQPDALLSLHINAAQWPKNKPGETGLRLVKSNHLHVLIFGCLSDRELSSPAQQEQFLVKLLNGSGAEELGLGAAVGGALAEATGLPASIYDGQNAIRVDADAPTVWARNLMLVRLAECPTVLVEPYIANSEAVYSRIQQALGNRAKGKELAEDDILIEYANGLVAGVRAMYQ